MKKLRVLIHRQIAKEPSPGTLQAYVLQAYQDGKGKSTELRGPNLLAGKGIFKRTDSVIPVVDEILLKQFKLIEPCEIEYIIEDSIQNPKI